jgi:hypothetical protein
MTMKAKHAFGALERVDSSIANGTLDAFDVLFVKDANGKPYVGWVDKDGNKVIVDNEVDLSGVEADISELEGQIATKIGAEEVDSKINTAVTDSVASANAYTDKMVEAAMGEHLTKKYEIANVPEGTLVDYRENEIRVMCPTDTVFTKQSVGVGGDANSYYMTFKTYAPSDDAVGYIEHLGGQSDEEVLTSFSKDEYGRRYQPTWLALAKYDEATGVWNYYGAKSTSEKMTGWDYQIDWFNANGVMIASDSVRINLSNESCHYEIKPYYVGSMMTEIDTKIEEKIKEVESSYEIIEF